MVGVFRFFFCCLFFVLSSQIVPAQPIKKKDRPLYLSLKKHIDILADDQLEGRRTGTPGALKASAYIAQQFAANGLLPAGTDQQWMQPFPIYEGKEPDSSSLLIMDGEHLKLGVDFFPLSWSNDGATEAIASPSLMESWSPWLVDIQTLVEGSVMHPHFDWEAVIRKKEKQALEKGATALIFFNSGKEEVPLVFDPKDNSERSTIPLVWITSSFSSKIVADRFHTWDIQLRVKLKNKIREAYNVVGLINNGAATTVVLGAHYDHLGYGEDRNSRSQEPAIHNGADDNASGVAALLELSKILKATGSKRSNYLFIAFSAEELGLLGSKYFVEHPIVPLESVNYMLNMDMIGRLNDSTKVLTVGGVGTSPTWGKLLSAEKKLPFIIKVDSSGTGPSDHTSFYRKNIPVLFFFTGLHSDYHLPSDDATTIHYAGELNIVKFIARLINRSAKENRLAFTKTAEKSISTGAKFSVSLGIMPDYAYDGMGVRVEGISTGKAAERAGLMAGDIVLSMDEQPVKNLESYMQLLSRYKKGDIASIQVQRGSEVFVVTVTF